MPKTVGQKPSQARRDLFKECRDAAGFTAYGLNTFGSSMRAGSLREGVACQEAQALATQAYWAAERWVYKLGHGRRGRPRFKPVARGIRSLASNDLNGALRVNTNGDTLTQSANIHIKVLALRDDYRKDTTAKTAQGPARNSNELEAERRRVAPRERDGLVLLVCRAI
jgi:hypothetical protein